MRVLLDEMLDRRLKRFFAERHEVFTVADRGWTGLKNGDLLRAAEEEFDAFVTADRSITHQQNLSRFNVAVVILEARSNSIEDLASLVGGVEEALEEARPGRHARVPG